MGHHFETWKTTIFLSEVVGVIPTRCIWMGIWARFNLVSQVNKNYWTILSSQELFRFYTLLFVQFPSTTVDGGRNPKQPPFGCIKPCKWWDKLPTSTGAGLLPSTVVLMLLQLLISSLDRPHIQPEGILWRLPREVWRHRKLQPFFATVSVECFRGFIVGEDCCSTV